MKWFYSHNLLPAHIFSKIYLDISFELYEIRKKCILEWMVGMCKTIWQPWCFEVSHWRRGRKSAMETKSQSRWPCLPHLILHPSPSSSSNLHPERGRPLAEILLRLTCSCSCSLTIRTCRSRNFYRQLINHLSFSSHFNFLSPAPIQSVSAPSGENHLNSFTPHSLLYLSSLPRTSRILL